MTERKCIVMIHGETNSSFTQYKIYPVYDDIVRNDDDVPISTLFLQIHRFLELTI